MSFCSDAKLEILAGKARRPALKQAQAYGLFLFARHFGPDEILLRSELREIPELAEHLLHSRALLGGQSSPQKSEHSAGGRTVYSLRLPNPQDRSRLLALLGGGETERIDRSLLPTPEARAAFLSGAFLSCGNVSDPQKGYHLELVVRSPLLCGELAALLDETIPGARATTRRSKPLIYYKDCLQIEDFLTLTGAVKASLAMIDIEMLKDVRNQANRATNCETANIDKLVAAATTQIRDIQLLLEAGMADFLPPALQQMAALRLENPHASLRELAELAQISRSGAHRRLAALSKLAVEARAEHQAATE